MPTAHATTLWLGYLSYDNIIPAGDGIGVNGFTIGNLTGTENLPPDFDVSTDLAFLETTLVLESNLGETTVNLGTVMPGFLTPDSLMFPETTTFSLVTFSAAISPGIFTTTEGQSYQPLLPTFTVSFIPSSGPWLVPGDVVPLAIEADTSQISPEPNSAVMAFAGLFSCWALRKRLLHEGTREQ